MARDKIVSADEAVEVVLSGDTVVTGGFVGIGFPEASRVRARTAVPGDRRAGRT